MSGKILSHGEAGIDAGTVQKITADRGARPFGRDHDNVHIFRWDNLGEMFVGNAEPVRKIKGIACVEILFDVGPDFLLRAITDQQLNNGAAFAGFFNREQRFARFPTVFHRTVPVFWELFRLADDDIESVVTHIQALGGTLNAVTDDRNGLLLQNLSGLGHGKLFACHHFFQHAAKINLHASSPL
ncbi:MAG: hypothetical protein BWX80_01844 [Candidatus Hydrogenedentes bacterium ADurb.Bin101]|nr:MAG: hypothetical protein BWX80_01844 [Candidatus Hydrogenedentes bacterium ADurb.Bin101]